ncbi:hypothetical protein B296_00046912, partial [Ensete ventricosum]
EPVAASPALPAQGGDQDVPRRQLVCVRLASFPSALSRSTPSSNVLFHVHNPCASNAGSRTATRRHVVDYGRTYVVRPKGRHQATIVWLHGLGDNGASWYQLLETLPLPNVRWFDIADPSQDGPDDADALEASAAHIANLLSSEPADGIAFDVTYHRRTAGLSILTPLGFSPPPTGTVKLGIGGFSMGAATALYSASCFAHGRYGNGGRYPINLSAVVGLSGWLPCSRSVLYPKSAHPLGVYLSMSCLLLLCMNGRHKKEYEYLGSFFI